MLFELYKWNKLDLEQSQNNAEDYLLGKKIQPEKPNFKVCKESEIILNEINEDFQKNNEDPLFQIKKMELLRKNEIMNNPVIMNEILQNLEEKTSKSLKKNKKKHKEKKRKKSRSDSYSERSRSRSRKKKLSKNKKDKKKDKKKRQKK